MSIFNCKSVVGGWQTQIIETGYLFGPVFNSINDLWQWQAKHLGRNHENS